MRLTDTAPPQPDPNAILAQQIVEGARRALFGKSSAGRVMLTTREEGQSYVSRVALLSSEPREEGAKPMRMAVVARARGLVSEVVERGNNPEEIPLLDDDSLRLTVVDSAHSMLNMYGLRFGARGQQFFYSRGVCSFERTPGKFDYDLLGLAYGICWPGHKRAEGHLRGLKLFTTMHEMLASGRPDNTMKANLRRRVREVPDISLCTSGKILEQAVRPVFGALLDRVLADDSLQKNINDARNEDA